MKYRTVVMYMEIGCFVSCLCGWILVCSTLPTEYWTFSEVGSIVLTTSNYYSNLWRDCISDTTGVSDCKDYPSMLALPVYLHACRALAVCAVITGFFGGVLTLVGMKCTKIGGSEIANSRVTFAGAVTYLASGFCGMITYSWWANRVVSEFVDPNFRAQKFELGAALFVGWGGALLLIAGGTVLGYFSGKEGLKSRPSNSLTWEYRTLGTHNLLPWYHYFLTTLSFYVSSSPQGPRRPATYASARTRRTYMVPASSSRVTLGPPLFYEGRKSRTTRATTRTTQSFSRDSFV